VTKPRLYESYPVEQAISFFGSPSEAQSLCNGQWLIFPNTVLCLTHAGEEPNASYFQDGSHFCWVADQPYRVNDQPWSHFVPAQVLGQMGSQRSHLFVRPPKARNYLYLGELEPSYMQRASGGENHGMARFQLKPALPSEVWLALGGLRLGNLDFSSVDHALDRLRTPTTVQDRLCVLQHLVEYWHGQTKPDDGMSDAELAGLPLPLPLRWWFGWAGKRSEVMSGQNILFKPRDDRHKYWQLAVNDGRLFFYIENQGVYEWTTLPEGDDPPVFGRYERTDPWEQEAVTLSEHLILMCLFEAVMCHAKYGASAAMLDEQTFTKIVSSIPPVAIGPWRWMQTRFFAGRGAFMYACDQGEFKGRRAYSVWIGAKTEHPLQFLKPHLDDSWEYVAV
jgi:hypothetical protein